MLVCDNLTVLYAPGLPPAVWGLSARFAEGRFSALIGPNGCGKSTILKAVMGFLKPATGRVTLDNEPISGLSRRKLARRIAYLPQESHCPDYLSLADLVELGGYARYSLFGGPTERDRALFRQALVTVGLHGLENAQVNSLSGGQRQRAWIAMTLAQDADIILLDEPVNHLDLKFQFAVLDLLKGLSVNRGLSIVTVLHDLNLASSFADDVIMLRDGQVAAAGPTRSVLTAENVKRVFDIEADIFARDDRLVCLLSPQQPGLLEPA